MDAKDARTRIVEAAIGLLAEEGAEGTSTRAVCEAARVTQPTLYHHFGDKEGLIEAAVTEAFERALVQKKAGERESDDPVEDLRRGWDSHVAFGIANPRLYAVMHGRRDGERLPKAAEEASSMLLSLTRRIARAGRLRVEPELAARIVWAAVYGVTSLLASEPDFGWPGVLNATVCEAVISAITLPAQENGSEGSTADSEAASIGALQLLAVLETESAEGGPTEPLRGFSAAEAALLKEWLRRLARGAVGDADPSVRTEVTDEEETP